MDPVSDDLYEPDETRPAKRVRLEAPLDVTEEMEDEMIDDEDLYGTDADGGPEVRAFLDEPHLKPVASEDTAHELPQTVTMADAGAQAHFNGSATPKVEGEDVVDTEDLYGGSKAQTIDDLPADAIDHGEDEFVAPPIHLETQDGVQQALMEETSCLEAESLVETDTSPNGEAKASHEATEQQQRLSGSYEPVQASNIEQRIAPERSRVVDDHPGSGAGAEAGKVANEDCYGDLEKALKNDGAEEVESNGNESTTAIKPKDDPEFLEAAAAQKSDKSAEWQFDSSDAESSSDSSDSSGSDSDSDSDSEDGYEMLDPATAAKILMSGDGDDDDGKEKGHGGRGPRTANEVKDEVVTKPDVKITDDMKITLLGKVDRVVESMALIQGSTTGEYQVLESGSVLCNASRKVIGAVAETFGRVQNPMYSVAFTNAKEIEDVGLQFGAEVFYVDSHSTFVFTQPLKGMKGTDASNIHDEEVGEDEMEFSDDEKEAEYKRMKKAAKRGGRGGLTRTDFNNSNRGGLKTFGAPGHNSGHTFVGSGPSDAPQTSYGGGMSYDDDDDAPDDFYQPLKRPDNLSELMSGAPPPPPSAPGGGFDRGRGRGRGRGDRGRGDRGRGRGGFNQRRPKHSSPPRDARGGHGQVNQRGARDQANGHRGSAHSFPDRHNNDTGSRGQRASHDLPAKPRGQESSTSAQISPRQQYPQYPPFPSAQPQQQQPQLPTSPQNYQFNGYTFQYGSQPQQPPAQYQQQQQQYYQNYQQPVPPQQQQSPGAPFPAGAYVNPAFWAGQQQQGQQYGGWGGQAQQPQQQYSQPHGQVQNNLADILRTLGGAGQGQR